MEAGLEGFKGGTCYFLGHSHIDAAWLWRFSETMRVFYETCEAVLRLMEKYPGFRFCQSSAQYYQWLEESHPETFEMVRRRVKEGCWEIVGGMWVESDGNMPSGESFVRQFLYGKRYFMEKLGVDVDVAWMPDSFGYAWTLPQIMRKSGIRFFLTQKLNWNDTTVFPYYVFKWTAPDGSSVLAHQTVGSYSEKVVESAIIQQMKRLISRHGLNDLLVLFGVGDHGGGVTEDMIERALEFIREEKPLKGRFSTAKEYFTVLTKKIRLEKLPEVKDELYLQFHRGTYTTQARVKRNNRRAECLLEVAEKFATIARRYGYRYPREELEKAWKLLLLNQFHDVLPGSSIPEVYEDSEEQFKLIFDIVNSVISNSLKLIAARVNTAGDGEPLLVFNPLSWSRTGVVEVELENLEKPVEVYDEKGRVVPSQVVDRRLIFIAEDVPSIGYKEYRLKRADGVKIYSTDLSSKEVDEEIRLENRFLTVKVDKTTGLVKSIFDKVNGMEVLSGYGNVIQIFEDYPVTGRASIVFPMDASPFDAWEIYIYQQPGGVKYVELKNPIEVKLLERGPVRAVVLVKYKYIQKGRPDSTFTQRVILYSGIPLVRFELQADWHAEHRLAKVAFPLNVHSEFTTYEIPYGFITRRDPSSPNATKAEKAKYEVPGQKWIDHTSEDGGYGVSLLNDCKYGFDCFNDVIRMTLLRSARYPTELRAIFGLPVDRKVELTDQGMHRMAYAIYPHASDFRKALTVRRGYEFNYPFIPLFESRHGGELPKVYSFISVEPENVILTVVKMAEDSDDLILRFYETRGEDVEVTIRLPKPVKAVEETDMMEKKISNIPVQGDTIKIKANGFEIKTLKVTMS